MHSFEKHGITYTVIDKIDDYTIIHRESNFQPWVVAYGFDMENHSWIQGYYCDTLESAVYTAKKANFWSEDWVYKHEEKYLIAIKKEIEGRLGMSPEEWAETYIATYDADKGIFTYAVDDNYYDIEELEVLGVIPIADPDDLLD